MYTPDPDYFLRDDTCANKTSLLSYKSDDEATTMLNFAKCLLRKQ